MRNVIKKMMCCALVLCATICFIACDKKDDPVPEPTPTPTPTPTPEKTYSGFACFLTLDCYGSKEDTAKLKQMVTDSIKKIYPEAKAEGNTISALFVSQNKDSINALLDQWAELHSSLLSEKDLNQLAVTARISTAKIQANGVPADWKVDISMAQNKASYDIWVPEIDHSIFSTADPKDQTIKKISFNGGWRTQKGDPIISMNEVKVNDSPDTLYATRLGAELFLYKNKDEKTSSYDFHVYPGNKLKLVKVDGIALAEDKQPEYVFESNIKQ